MSHFYVEISYEINHEKITIKQDLTRFNINKNLTAHLMVNPNNIKDFRVLDATDPIHSIFNP